MTIALRPARSTDAGKIGAILHGFETDTPWMPKQHSGAEAIVYCGHMIDMGWVTVAHSGREVLGFIACNGFEVCALYLMPQACGQGVGKRLLDHVKAAHPRLTLWTFQANDGAQRFYLREGFVEQTRSDGQRNDEGLADIEYLWTREETLPQKERAAQSSLSRDDAAKPEATAKPQNPRKAGAHSL